ncbi:LytR/AlgR family response regulator transcription factor [Flavobacterium sedimenticola]|uniref:LytTR family DNA-binding domain-containing protein n=1 Tax=Flavobacterium sedimenticola TaxID=3043286 RepID=A0ABT6XNW6_9FLAO|nr:LytTR family DNA-binding domain-containing protein [Flavobacterium sedimenticola]MDI9256783.1 LytTR family DNA-binding domain-containing protein [Flavobacterium sedimenticola]
MKTMTTFHSSDLELVSRLFGNSFAAEAKVPLNDAIVQCLLEAALVLADRIKGERNVYQKRFLVTLGQHIRSIAIEQVAYFESDGRYAKLVTHANEKYLLDTSLERLMTKLDPAMFYRINRKTIVSYTSIQKIAVWSKSRVKLELVPATDSDVIVSIDNSGDFKKWLNR